MARNPLDCSILAPFDVIRLLVLFPENPEREFKRFVVALNSEDQEAVVCFKPTSQSRYYDDEPLRQKGVVIYAPGEVPEFQERTFIAPNVLPIRWNNIQKCHQDGEFEILGRLPEDFRARMVVAVKAKAEWRRAEKIGFLERFDSTSLEGWE